MLVAVLAALALPATSQAATNVHAKEHKVGVGFGGSSITSGLSAKLFLNESLSVQGTAGYWWGWGPALNVDVLFEGPQIWSGMGLAANWFAGAGAGAAFGASYGLESSLTIPVVSGVVGASLQLEKFPVELTAEFRPGFILTEWGGFDFGGGGAVRYYF
jgi:hypothetical protein